MTKIINDRIRNIYEDIQDKTIVQDLKKQTEYTKGRHFFRFNKDEHIVRFHIGLEDPNDLIADLKRSLKHIK